MFQNKIFLITGGTGSFGRTVLERLIKTDAKEIRVFSRDEKKQDEMRNHYNNPRLKFYIGDVRNSSSLKFVMKNVDYVFHAAALKQVPSCEFFPLEAFYTNVLGTENVLNSAIENNVSKVVCLSTDKACYPVNAMGISKAMMEKVFIAKSRESSSTIICGTRYGNVLNSRGSVVPLFISQINEKKPITVTDPNMTRFIMTLDEAVDLVFYAFENGNSGDLFIQKTDSCKIGDLAIALKELMKSTSTIINIGPRHGEKLFETLMTREEAFKAKEFDNYFKIESDNRNLNYEMYLNQGVPDISKFNEYNSNITTLLSVTQIKEKIIKAKDFNIFR